MGWNPYLDEWTELHRDGHEVSMERLLAGRRPTMAAIAAGAARITNLLAHRSVMIARYAFAVPSQRALETIAALGPVVEMGAGTGYWARCLREMDPAVDVLAYDRLDKAWADWFTPQRIVNEHGWEIAVPEEGQPRLWTEVERGGPADLAKHGDRALLLVWPPMGPMGAASLRKYPGDTVVYVGEPAGGCTGDDRFHDLLDRHWDEAESFAVPQWDGVHDYLSVHRRRR